MTKNIRILTNRNFSDGMSWEAIEFSPDFQTYFWVGEDYSDDIRQFILEYQDKFPDILELDIKTICGLIKNYIECSCFSFPASFEFVHNKFRECGREFIPHEKAKCPSELFKEGKLFTVFI